MNSARDGAGDRRSIDRQIARLAIPALGALVAEPLFLAVDSAMVGHLGAASLAGLAIASTILQTAVGLMMFLAYATTPLVARRRGAGDLRGAVQAGVAGLWIAAGIGLLLALGLWALANPIIDAFGIESAAAENARTYLTISCLGLPAMLLVFAATGLLRGLQDTRTPLAVAGIGFTANALLNWLLIYGFGLGIAGAAIGTVIAQWGMVTVYAVVVLKHARSVGADLLPHRDSLTRTGRSGSWLFLRTLGLRAALLATVAAAATHGTVATAGYQVVFTVFSTAAFALDALAIAAQALIGDALGARNPERVKAVVRRTLLWGLLCGIAIGVVFAGLSPVLGYVFTGDERVLAILPLALLVLGASIPLAAVVFVLDGVLMGADDMKYLAWTSLVNLACYLPVLWACTVLVPEGTAALIALTAAFAFAFMAARGITLSLRLRGDRWITLGV